MKMNTLVKALAGGIMATALMVAPALANTYTSYSLGPLQGNNYTAVHSKLTNTQYITNKVTALSNTDKVTFWGTNVSLSQITPDYYQVLGTTVNIAYNTTQSIGTQVAMGMENYHFITTYAFVSGDVDFH